MSKFISEFNASLKKDRDDIWILTSYFEYESDLVGNVIVPKGFNTDLASVPRVPLIYSMWGARAHREAVIHDYLYRIDSEPDVPFVIANDVFLEAMKARGKPWYIRYPMYWGVCLGGKAAFHQRKVSDDL